MTRVGFIIDYRDSAWAGGANYYANLLHAIAGAGRIEPVILTGMSTPPATLRTFPDVETIRSDAVTQSGRGLLRRVAEKLTGRYLIIERLLQSRDIAVLSHSGHLGRNSSFPSIGWIPDFQHVRMPQFFSNEERQRRDRWFNQLANSCSRVLVSSEDARADLAKFRPAAEAKARVLRFVSSLGNVSETPEPREAFLQRYGIDRPFFHLPNQFWIHKNHAVVVEALRVARLSGRPITVIATGNTVDPRRPGHFEELMRRAAEVGCADNFKALGLVPYPDLVGFMRYSIGLINPSFFEGWSTTVEEAKSLGKTIILSDIPVHREQAPTFGWYFDPRSPEELAERMIEVAGSYSPEQETDHFARAQAELPQRIRAFAECYEAIVLDAISGSGDNV